MLKIDRHSNEQGHESWQVVCGVSPSGVELLHGQKEYPLINNNTRKHEPKIVEQNVDMFNR